MEIIKEIESVIKDNLKSPYVLKMIINLASLTNLVPQPDKFRGFIVNSENQKEQYWFDCEIDDEDEYNIMASISFCESLLFKIDEVVETNFKEIKYKMRQVASELSFIEAYCYGKSINLNNYKEVKDLIQKPIKENPLYWITIPSINFQVNAYSKLDFNESKISYELEVFLNEDKKHYPNTYYEDDFSYIKPDLLKRWAANKMNVNLEDLKISDYKILEILNY